jgi:hypothetical protein
MPLSAPTALDRLDDFRRQERCAQDLIAEVISEHLYGRHYDKVPAAVTARIEAAALRAYRSVQPPWIIEAHQRAVRTLDQAMASAMGLPYASQSHQRRSELARIGVQTVMAAFVGTFELANPFEGPVDALRIYAAAERHVKEVK